MKTLGCTIPFQNEYNGNSIKPLLFLSDKSTIQTILITRNINSGVILTKRNSNELVR
jgi:hypothetical protein